MAAVADEVFQCHYCARVLRTKSGRSQHERKAHPVKYSAANPPEVKDDFMGIRLPPRREDRMVLLPVDGPTSARRVELLLGMHRLQDDVRLFVEFARQREAQGEAARITVEGRHDERHVPSEEASFDGQVTNGRRLRLRKLWRTSFENHRRRTVDRIFLGQDLRGIRALPEGSRDFWQGVFEEPNKPNLVELVGSMEYETNPLFLSMCEPVTHYEVSDALADVSRSAAAGPDGVTKKTFRQSDHPILADLFSRFLEMRMVPRSLKRFTMHLLPKREGATEPSDHRPLNIGNLLRRLFSSILVGRMSHLLKQGVGQRGFQRGNEGVHLNVGLLSMCIKENIRCRCGMSYAYLDLRKAFDSVLHSEMLKALAVNGVPKDLLYLLADMYSGNETELQNGEVLRLEKGVVQGDPLSPLLFNIVLDEALRSVRGQGEVGFGFEGSRSRSKRSTVRLGYLAYADDLVIFAECPGQLAQKLNVLTRRLGVYGLRLNAGKSVVCHLVSGGGKVVVSDHQSLRVVVGGEELRMMSPAESYRYLGVSVTATGDLVSPSLEEYELKLRRLSESYLKAQQKVEALRDILMPQAVYSLDISRSTKELVQRFDVAIFRFVREVLGLPRYSVKAFLYADPTLGGMGLPPLWDSICRRRADRFVRTTDWRDRYVDDHQVAAYATWLSEPSSRLSRIAVQMRTQADGPYFDHFIQSRRYKAGWVREVPGWVPSYYYISCVRALLGVLNTPVLSARRDHRKRDAGGRVINPICPFCPAENGVRKLANLDHVLSACVEEHTRGMRTKRHDKILDMMQAQLLRIGYGSVLREPRIVNSEGDVVYKPDFIFEFEGRHGPVVAVMDPTIVSCRRDMSAAYSVRAAKYNKPLVREFVSHNFTGRSVCHFTAAIVDWKGCWSDASHEALSKIGFSASFLESVSMEVLFWGRKITSAYNAAYAARVRI